MHTHTHAHAHTTLLLCPLFTSTLGRYTSSTGSHECEGCSSGYFAPERGMTACLKCSSEFGEGSEYDYGQRYGSSESSAVCDKCVVDYFMNAKGRCSLCATGAVCRAEGTRVHTMAVRKGFYRFTPDSEQVYACPTDDCQGGNATGGRQCREGSTGPLCSVCLPKHFLRDSTNQCEKCSVANAWLGPLIMVTPLSLIINTPFR